MRIIVKEGNGRESCHKEFFLSLLLSTSLSGRSHHVEGYFNTKFVSLSTSKAITESQKWMGVDSPEPALNQPH